jgi:N-methylhydantoinase A
MAGQPFRIAVDIGGTFTDGVAEYTDGGHVILAKRLTTPGDPSIAVAEVVSDLLLLGGGALVPGQCKEVVHGTTLVTNAIIERDGATVGLLVTGGTRDVLDIQRETRYDLYDLDIELPRPLAPRDLRVEVDERMDVHGDVVRPLNMEPLSEIVAQWRAAGVDSVAVCLLHACVNPAHEDALAAKLAELMPDVPISLSSRVGGEIREYERMSTTTANAFVRPLAARYIERLRGRLEDQGISAPLRIMVSSGGFTSDAAAAEVPIALLESGPAGGVRSATNTAGSVGVDDVLTFDMGGTTAKACVSIDGEPAVTYAFEAARVRRFKKGSGLPIQMPSIDLIEIGAGGGSIAQVNELGLLSVGPRSAGSEPGPACYGQGGTAPTVTDADLQLGYLDPNAFLGGKMVLDVAAAQAATGLLGEALGLSSTEVAWGIHDVVNENMAAAARVHIAEKGIDPRRLTMVATGGAGPVHAGEVAHKLGIPRVLFTIAAGVGSCLGFLAAPVRIDRAWSGVRFIEAVDTAWVSEAVDRLEAEVKVELAGLEIDPGAIDWYLGAEMRYAGQGHTILVTLPHKPGGGIDAEMPERLRVAYLERYREVYGAVIPCAAVQTVTWRLMARSAAAIRDFSLAGADSSGAVAPIAQRAIHQPALGAAGEVSVYRRYELPPGTELRGPLILQEDESTIVVARPAKVEIMENLTVSVTLDQEEAKL